MNMNLKVSSEVIARSNLPQLMASADKKDTLCTKSGKVDMRVIKSLCGMARTTAKDGTGSYPLQVVLQRVNDVPYSVNANDKNAADICEMYAELATVFKADFPQYVWTNETNYGTVSKTDRSICDEITF